MPHPTGGMILIESGKVQIDAKVVTRIPITRKPVMGFPITASIGYPIDAVPGIPGTPLPDSMSGMSLGSTSTNPPDLH
jgi:hypothetical protein